MSGEDQALKRGIPDRRRSKTARSNIRRGHDPAHHPSQQEPTVTDTLRPERPVPDVPKDKGSSDDGSSPA